MIPEPKGKRYFPGVTRKKLMRFVLLVAFIIFVILFRTSSSVVMLFLGLAALVARILLGLTYHDRTRSVAVSDTSVVVCRRSWRAVEYTLKDFESILHGERGPIYLFLKNGKYWSITPGLFIDGNELYDDLAAIFGE